MWPLRLGSGARGDAVALGHLVPVRHERVENLLLLRFRDLEAIRAHLFSTARDTLRRDRPLACRRRDPPRSRQARTVQWKSNER